MFSARQIQARHRCHPVKMALKSSGNRKWNNLKFSMLCPWSLFSKPILVPSNFVIIVGFASVSCFISVTGNTQIEKNYKSTTTTTTELHVSPRDAQFADCVNGPKYTCEYSVQFIRLILLCKSVYFGEVVRGMSFWFKVSSR